MLKYSRTLIAVLAVGLFAGESLAKQISIGGRHSRAEIAKKCDAVGGVKDNTGGKKGSYGCYNFDKDTWVTCSASGKCTGTVPD